MGLHACRALRRACREPQRVRRRQKRKSFLWRQLRRLQGELHTFLGRLSFTTTGHGCCFWGELPKSGHGCGVWSSLCIVSVGEPCFSTRVVSHLQARGGRVQKGSCSSRAGSRGAAGGAARGARCAGTAQGRRQRAEQPERGRAGAAGRALLRRDPRHPWPPR